MTVVISLDVTDGLARLQAAAKLMAQPQALFAAVGAIIQSNAQVRYSMRVGGQAAAWAPLAASTVKRYKYKYPQGTPGHLLERTGLMRGSLSRNTGADFAEVGFSVPYAVYHVTGTKKMPRRDPLLATISSDYTQGTLAPEDRADIIDAVNRMLGQAL